MNSSSVNLHVYYSNNVYLHGYYKDIVYLHSFNLTNIDNFWIKICKFDTFFCYTYKCQSLSIVPHLGLAPQIGEFPFYPTVFFFPSLWTLERA